MAITVCGRPVPAERTMYSVLGECWRRYIAETNDVYVLDADLGVNRLLTPEFVKAHPGRFINVGIAEANLVGVACGLSAQGKNPFVHTFAFLLARRALDQVHLSGAFNRSSVKMVGIFPGVCADINGGTHVSFEDIAVMRAIPEMTVLEPCDHVQARNLLDQLAAAPGMAYMRYERGGDLRFYETGSAFEIGKAPRLRDGTDVTLCVAGSVCMEQAGVAADMLAGDGVSVRMLDMFSIKPLDEAAVREAIDDTGALVTVENHSVVNGLGAAVASIMAGYRYAPIEMVGVKDEFGEVGTVADLIKRYGLTAADIVAAARRAIARKPR